MTQRTRGISQEMRKNLIPTEVKLHQSCSVSFFSSLTPLLRCFSLFQTQAEEKAQDRVLTRRGSIAGRTRNAAGAAGADKNKTRTLMRDRFNFLRIVKKQLSDSNSAFKAGNDVTLPDTLKKFGTQGFEVSKHIQNFYKVNNPAFAAEHTKELHQRKSLTRFEIFFFLFCASFPGWLPIRNAVNAFFTQILFQ
jgi:hypothetical protein